MKPDDVITPPMPGVDKVTEALVKAQGEFPTIEKGRTAKVPMKAGGTYSYTYADLSDILTAVKPVLSKNGLCITQTVDGDWLVTYLRHSSGQFLTSAIPMVGLKDNTPQAMGSALTYSRRYCACLALGVVAEEDDDAQGAQNAAPKPNQPAARPQATRPAGAPPAPSVGAAFKGCSEPQIKRMYAIANEAMWHPDQIKELLIAKGYKSTKDIPWQAYQALCQELEQGPVSGFAPSSDIDNIPF